MTRQLRSIGVLATIFCLVIWPNAQAGADESHSPDLPVLVEGRIDDEVIARSIGLIEDAERAGELDSDGSAEAKVELRRYADVGVSVFSSLPEVLSLCLAGHPKNSWEVDLCAGMAAGMATVSSHVFYRRLEFGTRDPGTGKGWTLSGGPGFGVRGVRYCPFSTCAESAGLEVLISSEAVYWLSDRFGITLQADAGVAVMWMSSAPGSIERSYWLPIRLLGGVAF